MLQLVLGGAGSGKTTHLYRAIQARAQCGQRSILIVPEQFTSSTEARIFHLLGEEYAGMVESFSFTSLAEKVLTTCGGSAVQTLSDAGRAVLVRRAMRDLDDHVHYYHKQRRNAAFCQMVAQTIDELKSAGLSAERFTELSKQCGNAREKLEELALIFTTYEALLAQTGLDPSDRVNLAAAQLAQACSGGAVPAFVQDCAVFIDEFDTFNAPKQRLLGALFGCVEGITVALCADALYPAARTVQGDAEEESKLTFVEDLSLFSGARRVAFDLRRIARANGADVKKTIVLDADLRHQTAPDLARLTAAFAYDTAPDEAPDVLVDAPSEETAAQTGEPQPAVPPIVLFAAKSREEEARAVAAQIQRLVRAGVRYANIAVVCRTLSQYRTAIRQEFTAAGIPLFCDETTTPTFSAPVTAVRALLSIVRGIDYTDQMIALAKTGLCALPERDVLALENYVYTWSPNRAAWNEPFTRNPDGFGAQRNHVQEDGDEGGAERARAFLLPRIEKLCEKARGADATTFTKALYYCLEALGAPEQQAQHVATLRKTRGIPAAEAAARAWNVVMGLLDQMVHLLANEVVTPIDYAELFLLLLNASDLGHIPQSLDTVIFTSAGKMRLDNPDYVFVLGLAEGEFPAAPSDSGLLTHVERDALMAQNVELPECFENRLVREQICFYKALTAPTKGLWMSYPEGLGMPMSSALVPVLAHVPYTRETFGFWRDAATPAAALDRLGVLWSEDNTVAASLYAALQESGAAGEHVLTSFGALACASPKQLQQLDAMEALLGNTVSVSPSKVERYHICQYAYFLQYVLGLRPRQKAELSPNQSGNLMHWVLQMALSPTPTPYDAYKPVAFTQLSRVQLSALIGHLVLEYQRLYMPESSQRFSYLLERIKKSLYSLLCYIQEEQKQSGFQTAMCEAKIGTDPGDLPSWERYVRDDKTVRLIGTIDRVDQWVQEDGTKWVRVVDYKTGDKTFQLKEVYCGLDCQMLLYLFSLVRDVNGTFTGVKPAGVLYLLADPAPKNEPRAVASAPLRPSLEGMLADEEALLKAMDSDGDGAYLPFAVKNGKVSATVQKKKLADEAKMHRISEHLDGLVVNMAQSLYDGSIAAAPLCASQRKPCEWCEYRVICAHEDGVNEREVTAPDDPFGEPAPIKQEEEPNGSNKMDTSPENGN